MSQVNRNINIFYYCRVSKLCIDLIRMMDNYSILNRFFLKCIDDMDATQIPNGLDRVPTLIISGIDKPLVANEAVKWFNDNRPYLIQQTRIANKKIIYNITKNSNNIWSKGIFNEIVEFPIILLIWKLMKHNLKNFVDMEMMEI